LSLDEVHLELEESGRMDPPLEDRRRGAPGDDRRVEGPFDGLRVGVEVGRGDVEPGGHLVVAGHAAVGRQETADVEPRQREQVDERVLELAARQPPQPHAARRREPRLVGLEKSRIEPGEKSPLFVGRRLVGIRRRHLTALHPPMDRRPACESVRSGKIVGNRREVEAA
jgi:hypothetical protein